MCEEKWEYTWRLLGSKFSKKQNSESYFIIEMKKMLLAHCLYIRFYYIIYKSIFNYAVKFIDDNLMIKRSIFFKKHFYFLNIALLDMLLLLK